MIKLTILTKQKLFGLLTLFSLATTALAVTPYDGVATNGDTIRLVDLGLPSGTLWADRNIGADCPADTGNYYAWGETAQKKFYTWGTYMCTTSDDCGTFYDPVFAAQGNNPDISGTQFDAATVIWGNQYRMPTLAQIDELNNASLTTWTWTVLTDKQGHSMNGYLVTSKSNGNSIFLPASGYMDNAYLDGFGTEGSYRSAMRCDDLKYQAYVLYFNHSASKHNSMYGSRFAGRVIRPVSVQAATNVNEFSARESLSCESKKTLRDGHVFITLPNGNTYHLNGSKK